MRLLQFLPVVLSTWSGWAAEVRYPHHEARAYGLGEGAAMDVRSVAVDGEGRVWVATGAGFQVRASGEASAVFAPVPTGSPGPAFAVAVDGRGQAWGGGWNGLCRLETSGVVPVDGVTSPVAAIGVGGDGSLLLGGPDGFHEVREGGVMELPLACTRYVRAIAMNPVGEWHFATGMGVYRLGATTSGYLKLPEDTVSRATRGLAWAGKDAWWVAALGGLHLYRGGVWVEAQTARNGLPSDDVRVVRVGPDGALWVGTAAGLAYRKGESWRVRQGRRWLPGDDVRDLAFGVDGTAWVATDRGVGALSVREISLAEKAEHFHGILEARHVRPPGIVEKCRLRVPGDLTTWEPMDDDNDGGYTALALAMESYRYAATKDPRALAAARRAFGACETLRMITGVPGFLARSVVPAGWVGMHDPNTEVSDQEWAEERVGDPRNKRVPVRWRPSKDGRWLWKGDTSSDEVTAHFYGYYVYHRWAAQAEDRVRIRAQVTAIADHLMREGYVLRDLDGEPTRWGIWAPERLNGDPDWAMERGINSAELLSFLKLAYHVSGEGRYEAAYRELIDRNQYARNVAEAPNLNPAWRTYIDMELLSFAYPALLALETDGRLLRIYRQSLARWHEAVRRDGNPFFTFLHAGLGVGRAQAAEMDAARAFLVDTPLDLVRWTVSLGAREDLVRRRAPIVETWQVDRVLPPSETGYSRTDQNPWLLDQGDGGASEGDGVFWLLPYWMGRAHGWVP